MNSTKTGLTHTHMPVCVCVCVFGDHGRCCAIQFHFIWQTNCACDRLLCDWSIRSRKNILPSRKDLAHSHKMQTCRQAVYHCCLFAFACFVKRWSRASKWLEFQNILLFSNSVSFFNIEILFATLITRKVCFYVLLTFRLEQLNQMMSITCHSISGTRKTTQIATPCTIYTSHFIDAMFFSTFSFFFSNKEYP